MANLKDIIYLSNEDYETLVSVGSVTINGATLTYDADNLYITPEAVATTTQDGLMSSTDKTKLDGLVVNNATLTIQKNGSTVNTFTANASSNVTANITVPTNDSDLTNNRYVRYDVNTQSLTDTQKGYARTNIGAGTSSFSGDYPDLTNKPDLGTAAAKNYTTSITENSGDLITSGAVYSDINSVREVAAGKTATFVVSDVSNTAFNSQNATITISAVPTLIAGSTVLSSLSDLKLGDVFYVTETDVPDRWVSTTGSSSVVLSKMETAKVPVTDVTYDGSSVVNSSGVAIIPNVGVTKVSTGAGLTGGDVTSTGTIKANLNSETSLGTIGTTDKLYAVGVDANGKLAVNVPWTNVNNSYQTTLPTTTTAGKVLKSTSTAGTMEWGDPPIGVTITTTSGSENISDGTNALNVVTRDTTQTISGSKTLSAADNYVSSCGFSSSNNLLGSSCAAAMRGLSSNPFFGLRCNGTNYYLQATSTGLYLGPTSSVATSWATNGDMTIRGTNRPKWNDSNLALSSDLPTTYLKSASSSGNTLTLTKQDNTTVTYTPSFTDTNTTYTISASSTNGNITVTPSSGTAYDVSIPGLGSNAFNSTTIPTASITTTAGSEAATINGNSLNIVTRDTAQTISGIKTFNAPTNVASTEQTTLKIKTSNGGAIIFGKEGPNSGSMIRLDQTDGTCRLRFRSSATAGAMVWEQPENNSRLFMDFKNSSGTIYRVSSPTKAGTLIVDTDLSSYIPTSGSTAITGQLTLSTAASQNLGSAAKPWGSLHTVYTRFDSNGGSGSSYSNKANIHYDDATESLVFEFV